MHAQRWFDKHETVARDGGVKRVAFDVVIAKHAMQRHLQLREHLQCPCLGDVSRVDDVVNACGVEQFDNARDVRQMIVGI